MGVPGFFAWLLKQYKSNDIILHDLPEDVRVDILYIDANCLFHPQCFKILRYFPEWSNVDNLHEKMIKRILNYLDYLQDIVNPRRSIMISVDGVAPMAKMNQQRLRRYRSIDDMISREQIRKKHNKPISNRWSNTVITPGTEFMELLHNELLKYIKRNTKVNIRYSSYHSPGEGEHKILNDIRTRASCEQYKDEVYCVYGLDADLIFLSWASQKSNIYLLREANQLGHVAKSNVEYECIDAVKDVEEDLNFVSIDEMKQCFLDQCNMLIKKKMPNYKYNSSNAQNMSNDFIFVCYFLGNDFLPHLPSVDVNIGGLDIILDAYVSVYVTLQTNIIETDPDISINTIFLEMFLEYISSREEYYFNKILPKFMEQKNRRRCPTSDPYDREIWEIDNMRSREIELIMKNDPIKLGVGKPNEWKFRYYEHYYKQSLNQTELISNLCDEYFKGLLWVAQYYFKGCPSWSWKYPYLYAPFISDICRHIKNNDVNYDDMKLEDSGYLNPCEQLLAVLPPACSNLLPDSYKHLVLSSDSPIIDMFPREVELDKLYKYKDFQCHPKIPQVDPDRLRQATANLKLKHAEKVRNKIENEFNNGVKI